MSTDIWTESLLNELSDTDLNNFNEIVLADVKNKGCTDEQKSILKNNLDLWLYSLRITRREIELQLSQHKTNLKIKLADLRNSNAPQPHIDEAIIVEEKWRNNAMKFLTAIERKTLYVKLLLEEEQNEDD